MLEYTSQSSCNNWLYLHLSWVSDLSAPPDDQAAIFHVVSLKIIQEYFQFWFIQRSNKASFKNCVCKIQRWNILWHTGPKHSTKEGKNQEARIQKERVVNLGLFSWWLPQSCSIFFFYSYLISASNFENLINMKKTDFQRLLHGCLTSALQFRMKDSRHH